MADFTCAGFNFFAMIQIDSSLTPAALLPALDRFFALSGEKINRLQKRWDPARGTPVFTIKGEYTSRGWTEWTQGFQFGAALYQFEVTRDESFLDMARRNTVDWMASHITHIGVHDHGFNNVSTYGNLLRLMSAGRIPFNEWEKNFYELALKATGAVQAARWTELDGDLGYIYSFNGPHSLFADTIRSLRALALSHQLGHKLMGEKDRAISLLDRLLQHAETTARYAVYYGEGRDAYDLRGRTAHESIFNVNDGSYRCPNSQQGYSPFSTWTRGLAWILCGYPEEIEFLETRSEAELGPHGGKKKILARFQDVAEAVADFYLQYTPIDGIPYWDTGAPGLALMGDYLNRPAEPFNAHEPVDSSAAAIAAQGLLRLGRYLQRIGEADKGARYYQAGLTIARTLFQEPYLSTDAHHEGLILHSVYHRPNGWDYIPPGQHVPCGESSMWGDYHAQELAAYLEKEARGEGELRFFDIRF
jgi:unsaturated chondroitin disaccharide hydrolase